LARVFVSHSKDDSEGRAFFDKLFASVPHGLYWYSWEGPKPPHAETLRIAVANSASVFVVLSEEMDKPQTRSWVGYEVGLASALRKNVWVFERVDSSPVGVPVPYVTGYVHRFGELPLKDVFPFNQIAETAGGTVPGVGSSRPRGVPGGTEPGTSATVRVTICPYPDCLARYAAYLYNSETYCPVCRRGVSYEEATPKALETGFW
jgi:hypothetical protein